MNFSEIPISKVAFSQKVDCGDMRVAEGYKFVCKENGIRIVMDVEVVYRELVQATKGFIG